ncbi:MAG: ATP-binding protein [SAR324 cluster bacterium]|nr:ATP-binding protein [SAR324 cluster bacterium]
MEKEIIISPDSELFQTFQDASRQRIVFFAGLPGVGKSLYIQQFAKIAYQKGRIVHSMQWDVAREPFQSREILDKYPEIEGITHAAIRKAVGIWARTGILNWHKKFADDQHILVGEIPLVGNRLIELVQIHKDEAEPILAHDSTRIFIPVPSRKVRDHIVLRRRESIAKPRHQRESLDAPPAVVNQNWQLIHELAVRLGFTSKPFKYGDYDAEIYEKSYQYLLQHRNHESLHIDEILPMSESVYELGVLASELLATPEEVNEFLSLVEKQFTSEQLHESISKWYLL